MSSQKATVIPVPNSLKAKMGGLAALDASAIAKAEAAMQALSSNFVQWLNDEVAKLEASRTAIKTQGLNKETAEALYFRAHDLKGLGTTYEFPLVTKLAASLCRLIDDPSKRDTAPMILVDAHIDGIKAMVRDGIRDPEHPVGRVLAAELEGRVKQHLATA
jgi:chemotaxis protein histidine kinase CheA